MPSSTTHLHHQSMAPWINSLNWLQQRKTIIQSNLSHPVKMRCRIAVKKGKPCEALRGGECQLTGILSPGLGWGTHFGRCIAFLFQCIWQSMRLPAYRLPGIILPFRKYNDSKDQCKNYRGIAHPSIPGKVHSCLLVMHHKQQSGFTTGGSVILDEIVEVIHLVLPSPI